MTSGFSREVDEISALLGYYAAGSDTALPTCNENQLDALFILSLFRQSSPICFRHICSPSSGGILYIYNNWYVLCFLVDCLLAGLGWKVFITYRLYCLSSCLTILTVSSSALKCKSLRFNIFFSKTKVINFHKLLQFLTFHATDFQSLPNYVIKTRYKRKYA